MRGERWTWEALGKGHGRGFMGGRGREGCASGAGLVAQRGAAAAGHPPSGSAIRLRDHEDLVVL